MEDVAQAFWLVLTNPNITFLLLVLGLWSLVFAVSIPGTGLPEAGAVVCLALAAVGLVRLPVTAVGLALVGLAVVLFIVEFQVHAHGALLLAGAIALGFGALFLFRTEGRSSAHISWLTVVGTPLVTTALFAVLIRKGLAAQFKPALQDLRRLIGAKGVTRTTVGREGTVYVDGELWTATAEPPIGPDTDVVVVGRKGLVLTVAPAGQPETQPVKPPGG